MTSIRKIGTPAHLDRVVREKVIESINDLSTSHSSAIVTTCEHGSTTIRGRQELIDQCSLVGDYIRCILLIQTIGVVEMIGDFAGIDFTVFQIFTQRGTFVVRTRLRRGRRRWWH